MCQMTTPREAYLIWEYPFFNVFAKHMERSAELEDDDKLVRMWNKAEIVCF
jgi:hypothetical protein